MKKISYLTWATDDLGAEFERICLAMYELEEREEIAGYNLQYKKMDAVAKELQSRPGDHRRILLRHLDNRNLRVAYMAAHATLTIDHALARQTLKTIAATKWNPYAAEAEMTLDGLDDGTYKPS